MRVDRQAIVSLIKFSLFSTAAAVAYVVAHDLVTAHVAVRYFTVYHPHLVNSTSPIVMALLWGVLATWWVGLPAGIVIGLCNTQGNAPPEDWRRTRRRTTLGIIVLWLLAMCVLVGIYLFIGLIPDHERRPTYESDRRLMSVAVAHVLSYAASAVMAVIVAAMTWKARRKGTAADTNVQCS